VADGGSGLGLTIARAIVADHGGTLVADSDGPGRGATFTIELPTAP
jgi:signal transduction histidine kinase